MLSDEELEALAWKLVSVDHPHGPTIKGSMWNELLKAFKDGYRAAEKAMTPLEFEEKLIQLSADKLIAKRMPSLIEARELSKELRSSDMSTGFVWCYYWLRSQLLGEK